MHFDNLLFLLLVAVALLFRWLANKAGQTSKGSEESDRRSISTPQTPPPIPHSPAEADEERVRKFLEALGQPAGSRPPPLVTQRPTYQKPVVLPHVPPFASPLPPLTTKPPELPRKVKTFKPKIKAASFEVRDAMLTAEPAAPIKSPEAYAIATPPTPARSETNIAALLRSSSGLRNAIILREIFGPPRSLQPLDLIGQNL